MRKSRVSSEGEKIAFGAGASLEQTLERRAIA
jgi:hypothetical protein